MARLRFLIALMALFSLGCNRHRVEVLQSLTSPDGRWIVQAEFEYPELKGSIILPDAAGVEIARDKGTIVDLPSDVKPILKVTNETAGEYLGDRPRVAWELDAVTDTWHRVKWNLGANE